MANNEELKKEILEAFNKYNYCVDSAFYYATNLVEKIDHNDVKEADKAMSKLENKSKKVKLAKKKLAFLLNNL
jgi:hypothetical protein